jgi:RNA polymerase sigma factor (TIGR02999 family)
LPVGYSVEVSDFTQILERVEHGDPKAADELLPLVYDELRRLAAHKMANEAAGQTLQPTALVHEAWLRLVGNENQRWDGRAHFFAAAAEAMRRIRVIMTSGRMEGINRKIQTLFRQVYGFRDDDFLRLKLYALHEAKHKLVG